VNGFTRGGSHRIQLVGSRHARENGPRDGGATAPYPSPALSLVGFPIVKIRCDRRRQALGSTVVNYCRPRLDPYNQSHLSCTVHITHFHLLLLLLFSSSSPLLVDTSFFLSSPSAKLVVGVDLSGYESSPVAAPPHISTRLPSPSTASLNRADARIICQRAQSSKPQNLQELH
jgi:hypothetical protein